MKSAGAVDRYLNVVRASAAWWTARAAAEARHFMQTGEHQRLADWVTEKDDAAVTRHRLARYQEWLVTARRAGRYQGGTRLKRILPDGASEPWGPPAPSDGEADPGRLGRALLAAWRRVTEA